jgi:hypothetical protein
MESPEVFWLNVTNAALGFGFLALLGAIGFGIAQDFIRRHRHQPHTQTTPECDPVLRVSPGRA